ncbi:sensor histidine kinase [Nonomuraea phyllanthi]|uniref:histidine kinase n=1 Tax=Nonomuraea phyllanthi TaxID=2219224 RepID=A0A5C4VIJ0_9ACTN|nr:sensor histidine kinase [Nonomuraea phyllanthi]
MNGVRRLAEVSGRCLALLALKVLVALLVALPVLVLLRLNGVVLFPALLVLVFAGRRMADVSRRLQGRWAGVEIVRPYLPRPALEPTAQSWYWTGYDYHHSRLWAAVSSWFNWVLRDPATWRDLAWMVLDPAVGTILLAPAVLGWARPFRWHARWTRALLSPTDQAKLTARVRELAETRTEALDAQAAELERIERDLHDGAQARLIAVGLSLSLAQQQLRHDPDAVEELLAEARATAADALRTLRDLVHGIRPPVLSERGLVDALRLLGLEHPLAVTVEAELPGRLPPALESAVYFATAELLVNVTKHAHARAVRVRLEHRRGTLRVAVTDDGVGGADPARGTGIQGIQRRLRPFDGTVDLDSPPAGPTVATLEVPCALSSPRTSTC